jgi:hypothetical protein
MRNRGLELVSESPRPGRGGLLAFEVRPHFGRTNPTANLIVAKRTDETCGREATSTTAEDLSDYKSKVAILRIKGASEGMPRTRLKKL